MSRPERDPGFLPEAGVRYGEGLDAMLPGTSLRPQQPYAVMDGPRVPSGLGAYLSPELSQDFAQWQDVTGKGVERRMDDLGVRTFDVGDQRMKAIVVKPSSGNFDGRIFAEPFPHPQKWTKGMAVRSLVHAAATPDSLRVFYPHGKEFYTMSTEQRERMFNGDEKVLPELLVRVLEQLYKESSASAIGIIGESLGANLGVGMAAVNQDLPITDFVGTEIVSGKRGRTGLLKLGFVDLARSTGQDTQRAAVVDSGIPVLRDEIFTEKGIARDWRKAGLAYLSLTNLAIQTTMLGERRDIVTEALDRNDDLFIVLNRMHGSHIHKPDSIGPHERLTEFMVESDLDLRHMAMDNPYTGAALMLRGLAVNAAKRQTSRL